MPARTTESAPPAPAPEVPGVALQINAAPTSARIELDGALVEGNPATVRVARGGTAVRLRVQAPGHVAIERWIAPDRDRTIEIVLAPEPQAAVPAPTQEPASRGRARTKSAAPRRPASGGSDIFTDLRGPR